MSLGVIGSHAVIGGGSSAAYWASVLTDTPWGAWKTDEVSGSTLVDSSGNTRPMTITGAPTFAQAGPNAGISDAIQWNNVASQHAETVATTNAGAITFEAWVYLTANPGVNTAILARSTAYNTAGAADGDLYVQTDGRAAFHVYNGSSQLIVATNPLALNTWHHVVGSVGAAGLKLRVDKANAAATQTGVTTAYTGASQMIFMRGGASLYVGTGVIKIARAAYYTAQLSDARTDAHYDAL